MLIDTLINSNDKIEDLLVEAKQMFDLDELTYFTLLCDITNVLNAKARLSYDEKTEQQLRTVRALRDGVEV